MPSYPIWSSGSTDSIAPQIYQWAAADRAEQSANIGRRTAYDQQAIQNAQNYYQFARGNEDQDYRRQHDAEAQNYARQLAVDQQARGDYRFSEEVKLSKSQLKQKDDYNKKLFDYQDKAEKAAIAENELKNQADSESKFMAFLATGKGYDAPEDALSTMFKLKPSRVKELRKQFPSQALDMLNARVAEIVAKTDPSKINLEGISGLSAELPASVRDHVTFNPVTKRFELLENAFRPVMGGLRYNFGDSGGTGTTPPPAPAPLMQGGNQGGGYFQSAPAISGSQPKHATHEDIQAAMDYTQKLLDAPPSGDPTYTGEDQARAAGHRPGDIVRIVGVGKVRLR